MTKRRFFFFLGIDVSKAKLDLCLLDQDSDRPKARLTVSNNPKGFARLLEFLTPHAQDLASVLTIFESTGCYGRALEQFLFDAGLPYVCVNPAQIKYHGVSRHCRTKTDAADARLIALFGQERVRHLVLSKPLTPKQRQLQALVREMEALIDTCTAAKNRLEACEVPRVRESIQAQIDLLSTQIKALEGHALELVKTDDDLLAQHRLLCSIKGIAHRTSLRILAEIVGKVFTAARQLAAYAGLTPSQHQSGSSVKGRTRMCKTGNARLRTALYLPAQVARRHCRPIKLWADALSDRGLAPKAIIGAVMRKLAHIVFGVLKHKQPFDIHKLALPQLSY